MKGKWEKEGDFAIVKYANNPEVNFERDVLYKNLNPDAVIEKIDLVGNKDKSLILYVHADEKNFLLLMQKYEQRGFGKVSFGDEICNVIRIHINSTDTHKIKEYLDFLSTIEPLDFVYNDIKTVLNLKPSHQEIYRQLIKDYESKGLEEVVPLAKEAVSNGYDEAFFVLAKRAQQLDKLDDVLDFLMETKDIQSSEANTFRFEFAHFIYTASPENQRYALKILLITKNEYAAELRSKIYNEFAGLYGTALALKALDIDVDTVMYLGEVTCSLSKENNELRKENEKLTKQIEELKMLLPKPNIKPSSSSTFFNNSDTVESNKSSALNPVKK